MFFVTKNQTDVLTAGAEQPVPDCPPAHLACGLTAALLALLLRRA